MGCPNIVWLSLESHDQSHGLLWCLQLSAVPLCTSLSLASCLVRTAISRDLSAMCHVTWDTRSLVNNTSLATRMDSGHMTLLSVAVCPILATWPMSATLNIVFLNSLTATTCPDPGTPIHGHRDCSTANHAFGSTCQFSCSRGYHLQGAPMLVCQANGDSPYWSGPVPICQSKFSPGPSVLNVVLCTEGFVWHFVHSKTSSYTYMFSFF